MVVPRSSPKKNIVHQCSCSLDQSIIQNSSLSIGSRGQKDSRWSDLAASHILCMIYVSERERERVSHYQFVSFNTIKKKAKKDDDSIISAIGFAECRLNFIVSSLVAKIDRLNRLFREVQQPIWTKIRGQCLGQLHIMQTLKFSFFCQVSNCDSF